MNPLFMKRALELAQKGLYTVSPNPRVGCVVVQHDQIVGEGWHEYKGGPHAEIHALFQAGDKARGATAYVTLEPCSHQGMTGPCTVALIQAGIKEIIIALRDPNPKVNGRGIAELRAAGISVKEGLLHEEAEVLNLGFIKRMREGRPYVRAKMAFSLDGRTALANGKSQWITGAEARQDNQYYRARSCAIVTGINTILTDDPQMNVRCAEMVRQPIRIVLDSALRIPLEAKILNIPPLTILVTALKNSPQQADLEKKGAEIWHCPKHKKIDLRALMKILAERECNEIHLESGPILLGAFLEEDLVDELVCYMAPKLLGQAARPMVYLSAFEKLSESINLKWVNIQPIGTDLKLILRRL